jgi:DNA-binding transcriptional MocR family regulator
MSHSFINGSTARDIHQSMRQAIRDGRLPAGTVLPAIRDLATQLHVNRNTVGEAYKRLAADGYVRPKGRRGTIVTSAATTMLPSLSAIPAGMRNLADGNPDPHLLPHLRKILTSVTERAGLYGEYADLPALVQSAPSFFRRQGISSEQVMIAGGTMDGLERIITLCLRPGDRIGVEDPGFASALELIRALGIQPVPIQLDSCGMMPDSLERCLRAGVEAVLITPIAQNPTGASMTLERAQRIRYVLRKYPDVLAIEDDHFSPLATTALAPMRDPRDPNWVALCSVSKYFGPDLRLAVVFGEQNLLKRLEARQRLGARWVSHVLQSAVLKLMLDPATKTTLKRAARSYAERRTAMKAALESCGYPISGGVGINLWVQVPDPQRVTQILWTEGWAVRSGAAFTIDARSGIRLSIGRITTSDVAEFAEAFRGCATIGQRSLTA